MIPLSVSKNTLTVPNRLIFLLDLESLNEFHLVMHPADTLA